MKDLFELPEKWPPALAEILERYEEMDNDYKTCEALLKEVEAIGYTFEYGLDAEPYNLRLKQEDMKHKITVTLEVVTLKDTETIRKAIKKGLYIGLDHPNHYVALPANVNIKHIRVIEVPMEAYGFDEYVDEDSGELVVRIVDNTTLKYAGLVTPTVVNAKNVPMPVIAKALARLNPRVVKTDPQNYQGVPEVISLKPFTRSDIMTYLILLDSFSPQILGGMELGAMRDMTAERYDSFEVYELGEMGKQSITTVKEDLLEPFCDAVNAFYEQCDNEDDKFLSMARVYNMARQFADGGILY